VDAAGLIGEASQYRAGLMPVDMTKFNIGSTSALDFNNCRDLFRLYSSYGSINGPVSGGYYWGIFNIGHSTGWLIQIACGAYTDGTIRMYRRMFYSATAWTEWTRF